MSDWIEDFLNAVENVRSPSSFKLWTGIAIVAAVLERRVWTETDAPDPLRPNLYTFLTGPPAAGKGMMITAARRLLAGGTGVYLGPDNPTKRSFLNEFEKSAQVVNGFNIMMSMTVLCPEMGVLISKYEKDFVADLTHIYDNPPKYTAPRQTSDDVELEAPTLNLIVGATPDALGDTMPETAWGQGFTSRIIFIYGAPVETKRNIFQKSRDSDMTELAKRLKFFRDEFHGAFEWDDEAKAAWDDWYNVKKMKPVPTYGRLVNYAGRRNEHAMKLAMISAISAGRGLTVTLKDWKRALKWLFAAERRMPDVFRAMVQKSDQQLMADLHHHMLGIYNAQVPEKRNPIPVRRLWQFLENKTTSDKIEKLILAAERIGYIRRSMLPPDTWIPNPLDFRKDSEEAVPDFKDEEGEEDEDAEC